MYTLTRAQIIQLYQLIQEYSDEDTVTIAHSNRSGIGTNTYATIQYAAGTRQTEIDITDYENW